MIAILKIVHGPASEQVLLPLMAELSGLPQLLRQHPLFERRKCLQSTRSLLGFILAVSPGDVATWREDRPTTEMSSHKLPA